MKPWLRLSQRELAAPFWESEAMINRGWVEEMRGSDNGKDAWVEMKVLTPRGEPGRLRSRARARCSRLAPVNKLPTDNLRKL